MEIAKLPMISLQRQALTNFASSVWVKANKQSLRSALDNHKFNRNSMNDCAIAELKRSNVPTVFKEMTMMILTDVGDEIREWLNKIKDHVDDTTLEHQVANLSWTIEGPLNRPKMARLLLQNQSDLPLYISFKMACNYGLEDKVRELLPRIREERHLNGTYLENLMVHYWLYKLNGNLVDPLVTLPGDEFERYGASIDVKFFLAVTCSFYNIETVKFLFNHLSDEEKIEALNVFKSLPLDDFFLCDERAFAYVLSQFNVTEVCDFISRYDIATLMSHFKYFAWPNTKLLKAFDQYIGKMKGTKNTNGNDLLKLADGSLGYFRRYNQKIVFRYYWSRFSKNGLNKALKDSFSSLASALSPALLPRVFYQLFRNEDDVSIKMVIDSIGPKGYPKDLNHRYSIVYALAKYDLNLLKYYLARALYRKTVAENLIKASEYDRRLVDFKDIIAEILIEIFPHWNLNRIN